MELTREPSEVTREPSELTREPSEVVVTASDGRQFRLVTPAGADPVQFASEYVSGLSGGPGGTPADRVMERTLSYSWSQREVGARFAK